MGLLMLTVSTIHCIMEFTGKISQLKLCMLEITEKLKNYNIRYWPEPFTQPLIKQGPFDKAVTTYKTGKNIICTEVNVLALSPS